MTVYTDGKAALDARKSYAAERSRRAQERNAGRAMWAALAALQASHNVHINVEFVPGHQRQGESPAAHWNNEADRHARKQLRVAAACYADPRYVMDLREADGPAIVVTAAGHPTERPGWHVVGDPREEAKRIVRDRAIARRRAKRSQYEVLDAAGGVAVLKQTAAAVGPTAKHSTQRFVVRAASATLPSFVAMLRADYVVRAQVQHGDGEQDRGDERLERLESGNYIRRIWHRPEYRHLQAMRRCAGTRRLQDTCVLCDREVPDTVGHFVDCPGGEAQTRRNEWVRSVTNALIEAQLARDAEACRVAAEVWDALAPPAQHWSSVIGFYQAGHLNQALETAGATRATKPGHHRKLRRAMVEAGEGMWDEKVALLLQRVAEQRRPEAVRGGRTDRQDGNRTDRQPAG